MTKYTGGKLVKGGYYWNPKSWAVEVVPAEGGRLPLSDTNFVKVPFPLLFVIVPVLGALFLMFLPLIGFALLGYAIVRKVTGGVKESATELAATVSPGWVPGEAHLTGKPGEEKAPGTEPHAGIRELEDEVAAKRGDKS
jgi:hypothetical protein